MKVRYPGSLHRFPFFFFVCLLIAHYANQARAQEYLDSLEVLLDETRNTDDQIRILGELSERFLDTDPEKALKYTDQLQALSERTGNAPGIVDALSYRSRIYRALYSYDTALVYSNHAIRLADSLNDTGRLAGLYHEKGRILFRTKGPRASLSYYQQSYSLYKSLDDSLGMSDALNGMGIVFMRLSEYDSAVFYFLNLASISEKAGFEEIKGKAFANLGISYYDLNDYDQARKYLEASIPIFEKYQKSAALCVVYNNLGNLASELGDFSEAEAYYRKALDLGEKSNDKIRIAEAILNIGNLYEQKKDYRRALEYYQQAKDLYEEVPDWNGFMLAYKNIGLIHERRGQYDLALTIYDSCLAIAGSLGALYTTRELYFNIYKVYQLKGNYRKAFEYLEMHDEVKDSIFNLEKAEVIADYEMKYEKEKDQAMILALEKENLQKDLVVERRTSQRNVYLFTGLGIVIVILFFFLYYRQKAVKDRIIAEQKIRQLEEEKKMLAAKALVEGQEDERKRIATELHDGLGVLLSAVKMQFTNIKDKSPENQPLIERASQLLEEASGDVRKISHNMMPGLLTKFGLYEAVSALFEDLAETPGLEVSADIPEDAERLPENKEIMLYRVIQEMVNNTLKHAGAKNIELKVRIIPGWVQIRYADDGKGFDTEEKLESKTIGLQSIQSRMNFLNGKMSLSSKPGEGTIYELQVPA